MRTHVGRLPSGPDQPFYYMLPDDDDCSARFGLRPPLRAPRTATAQGGGRRLRYVAQENLEDVSELEKRIHNRSTSIRRASRGCIRSCLCVQ